MARPCGGGRRISSATRMSSGSSALSLSSPRKRSAKARGARTRMTSTSICCPTSDEIGVKANRDDDQSKTDGTELRPTTWTKVRSGVVIHRRFVIYSLLSRGHGDQHGTECRAETHQIAPPLRRDAGGGG